MPCCAMLCCAMLWLQAGQRLQVLCTTCLCCVLVGGRGLVPLNLKEGGVSRGGGYKYPSPPSTAQRPCLTC